MKSQIPKLEFYETKFDLTMKVMINSISKVNTSFKGSIDESVKRAGAIMDDYHITYDVLFRGKNLHSLIIVRRNIGNPMIEYVVDMSAEFNKVLRKYREYSLKYLYSKEYENGGNTTINVYKVRY